MKKFISEKSLFKKLVFFFNNVNVFLIFTCFILFYFYDPLLSSISFLTFLFPVFYLFNIIFLVYWIIKIDFRFVLSLLVLIILQYNSFSIFNFNENDENFHYEFHIMSFNARLFNHYNWIKNKNIPSEIKKFFNIQSPDIVAIQEYHRDYKEVVDGFKYNYVYFSDSNSGKSIHSKKEIVGKGIVNFSNSSSNAIYIDVVNDFDTLRVYNAHFESYKIDIPSLKANANSLDSFLRKTKYAYEFQEKQLVDLFNHMDKSPYKIMLAVDLNNTPHSYVYRKLNEKYNDLFIIKGSGFGSTYAFNFLPLRIDYLFTSKDIISKKFKIHNIKFSDHRPISGYF